MQSSVAHSSYVIDFLDVDFDSNKISDILKKEADQLLNGLNITALEGWKIEFRIIYGNIPQIAIYKALPSSKTEKHKQITIHVPVPTIDVVSWGVRKDQLVSTGFKPETARNFTFHEVNFQDYANRTDYILDSIRNAIKQTLREGFTVNGLKVVA